MTKIVNKKALAETLGVSERSLTHWQKAGMPIKREGAYGAENEYSTADVVRWMVQREAAKIRQGESARDVLARRQTEEIEERLKVTRGQAIQACEIKPAWVARVVASRQALRDMVADIVPALAQLDGPDAMRDLLEEAIDEALRHVATCDDEPWSATGWPVTPGGCCSCSHATRRRSTSTTRSSSR
jgi:phage terminase Nu1 subunit (DNA packaging protein)